MSKVISFACLVLILIFNYRVVEAQPQGTPIGIPVPTRAPRPTPGEPPTRSELPPLAWKDVRKHLSQLGITLPERIAEVNELAAKGPPEIPDNYEGAKDDGLGEQVATFARALPHLSDPVGSSCTEWKPVPCWCFNATKYKVNKEWVCLILDTFAQEYRHPTSIAETAPQLYQSSLVSKEIMSGYRERSGKLSTDSNFMSKVILPPNLQYTGIENVEVHENLNLNVSKEHVNFGTDQFTGYHNVPAYALRRVVKLISDFVNTPVDLPAPVRPKIDGCRNVYVYVNPKLYSVHDTKIGYDMDPHNWYVSEDDRNFLLSYIPQMTSILATPWGPERPNTAHSYSRDPMGRQFYDLPAMNAKIAEDHSLCLRQDKSEDSGEQIDPLIFPQFQSLSWKALFNERTWPCLFYRNWSLVPLWQQSNPGWNAINNGVSTFKAAVVTINYPEIYPEMSFKRPDELPHNGKDLVMPMKGPYFEEAGLMNKCSLVEKSILGQDAGGSYNEALMLDYNRQESSELLWKWVRGFPRYSPWGEQCDYRPPPTDVDEVPEQPEYIGWIHPGPGCNNFHYGK